MRQRTFSFSLLQAWCICKHTNNNFKIFNSIKRVEGVNHVSILHALGNQPELLRCPLQGIFQECWLRITLQGRKPLDDSGLLYLIWIASSWVSTSLPITKRVLTYRSLNDPCLIKWGVSGTVIPDWVTSLRSWNRMPFKLSLELEYSLRSCFHFCTCSCCTRLWGLTAWVWILILLLHWLCDLR